MPDLTEAGKVETHADGSKTFTHGHRYPDNTQIVTQEYAPNGQLQSAKVEWSGFAGKVMDLTATFDKDGQLLKEDGFRAEGMTTPVKALLKPLPAAAAQATPAAAPAPTQADAPVVVPSLDAKPAAPSSTAPSSTVPASTGPASTPAAAPPAPASISTAPISTAPTSPAVPATAAPTTPAEDHTLSEGLKKIYGEQKRG